MSETNDRPKLVVLAAALCWLVPLAVLAITNPPYDLYGYLADSTDNPPLNYMKVCEPGRDGETNASYVVLGRQSLYSGDWTPVAAGHAKDYNFFKVTVEMK